MNSELTLGVIVSIERDKWDYPWQLRFILIKISSLLILSIESEKLREVKSIRQQL